MFETKSIPLSDLLLDPRNARLRDEQPSQPATILAIARQQDSKLLKLAADIVEKGVNPLAVPAVVPADGQSGRYMVIEGNRRVAALKGLETPALILPAFNPAGKRRLTTLAKDYDKRRVDALLCAVFETEEELAHWVTLTHTGQNEGVGLVEWGADEKDRYAARHGTRSPAGQILDWVEGAGTLSAAAAASDRAIITNLARLLSTPKVREALGIEIDKGQVKSWYPAEEALRGLTKVVDDLKCGRINVGDIYTAADRARYAESLSSEDLPDPDTRLGSSVPLDETRSSRPGSAPKSPPKRPRRSEPVRTAVVPPRCHLNVTQERTKQIFKELHTLNVEQYPNACAVTLRVFVELSMDSYIEREGLLSDEELRNTILAKKLKTVAADLRENGQITLPLERVIIAIADNSRSALAAELPTLHRYVHNHYSFPRPSELKTAWDELQPFLEAVWP